MSAKRADCMTAVRMAANAAALASLRPPATTTKICQCVTGEGSTRLVLLNQ
jgi:hypothetical protein